MNYVVYSLCIAYVTLNFLQQILACSWRKENSVQLYNYDNGKLITTLQPDVYSSSLYCAKYITNLFVACGGCDVNLFRIIDMRSHSVS